MTLPVRSKAGEWGLKSDRIGFLGFSAGGHLTAWVSTNFDKRAYEAVDCINFSGMHCRRDIADRALGPVTPSLSPSPAASDA